MTQPKTDAYEQLKSAHEQLVDTRELNEELIQLLDKKQNQLDNIWCAIEGYRTGKHSKGIAFDRIMREVDYPW